MTRSELSSSSGKRTEGVLFPYGMVCSAHTHVDSGEPYRRLLSPRGGCGRKSGKLKWSWRWETSQGHVPGPGCETGAFAHLDLRSGGVVSKDSSTGPLRKGAAETQPSLEAGAQP